MLKSFSGSYEDVEERIKYYLNESESRNTLHTRRTHSTPIPHAAHAYMDSL